MAEARYFATAPTLAHGQPFDLRLDSSGQLIVALGTGDIQLGAIELKNGTTDTRATVLAASTAAAATDTPLVVAIHPSSIGKFSIDQTTPGTTNAVDTELPAAATIAADGVTPTVPGLAAYTFLKTPGANTWDRWYSALNGTNSTGVGIGAVAVTAQFDDAAPTSITENQFGNVRMSANRNLYGTIRDAAGNERGANVNASNALSVALDQTTAGTTNAVAVAQIGANTVLTGNGATGTGALRVSIANDSTGIVALPAAGTSVVGSKAPGTAAATSVLDGGVYNSTVPTLTDGQQASIQLDTTGALRVQTEGKKTTYSAGATISPVASATDVFTILGSATKTVRITRISLTSTANAASLNLIVLRKYSTAYSGGTSAAATIAPHDSGNAAATAVVLSFTANPTVGTSIGNVRAAYVASTTVATPAIAPPPTTWTFGDRNGQSLVLRGTSQYVAINLVGVPGNLAALFVDIEWTEE